MSKKQPTSERRNVVSATWTDPLNGTTVRGTVVRQNGSSIYVQWAAGRIERISRRDIGDVVFTAAQDAAVNNNVDSPAAGRAPEGQNHR